MCFFGSSNPTPTMTAAPTQQSMAREQEAAVTSALDRERRARALAAGRKSTILTGAQGAVMPAPGVVGSKTMLGG